MPNHIRERCSVESCRRCGMMNRKRLTLVNLWIAMKKVTANIVRLRLLLWQDNLKLRRRWRKSFNLHLRLRNRRKHQENSHFKCLLKTILPKVLTHRKTNSTSLIVSIQSKWLLSIARFAYLPSIGKAKCSINLIKTHTSNKFTTVISTNLAINQTNITNSNNSCPILKMFSMLALIRERT